mgnify:CR=1 FL=1
MIPRDEEPALDELHWVQKAACIDAGLDWPDFFVEAGHSISEEVKAVCRACPVREECLRWAYMQKLTAGYFGGISAGDRKKMTVEEAVRQIRVEQIADREVRRRDR